MSSNRATRATTWAAPSLLVLLLALTGAGAAGAQDKQFEITPHASYLVGGSFDLFDPEFGRVDFEVEEDAAFGVMVDIPITGSLQVELSYLKQDTELQIDEGLFGDDFTVADIEIDTYLVGILWQGTFGQARPFFVAGLGLSDLSLDVSGTDDEVRPAFSLGGGVKTMFTPHLGLRFEGRILAILLEDDDDGRFGRRRYDDGQALTQGQLTVGVVFAF
ncbi:MAG TPA: outer membrane beta-barrel protein [Thermoanaerobaculia bacterium]|nr:outer membrane beta-barrel protein [Thermoanaerobaculia bacterium]